MAQRIAKLTVVPTSADFTKGNMTFIIEGTDGDPSGNFVLEEVTFADYATPTQMGDALVGDFPEIDLPTT